MAFVLTRFCRGGGGGVFEHHVTVREGRLGQDRPEGIQLDWTGILTPPHPPYSPSLPPKGSDR